MFQIQYTKKIPFLTLYLKQNINKISEKFTEVYFNLEYFAYFRSNYVNFVFKDTITLGKKINKKVKSKKRNFIKKKK